MDEGGEGDGVIGIAGRASVKQGREWGNCYSTGRASAKPGNPRLSVAIQA